MREVCISEVSRRLKVGWWCDEESQVKCDEVSIVQSC